MIYGILVGRGRLSFQKIFPHPKYSWDTVLSLMICCDIQQFLGGNHEIDIVCLYRRKQRYKYVGDMSALFSRHEKRIIRRFQNREHRLLIICL